MIPQRDVIRSPRHLGRSVVEDLKILTEYELGRGVTAIEWVARGGKPIAEIGGRILAATEVKYLAVDLNRCLEVAGEPQVRGFIMRDTSGWWQFGFYQHRWAILALLYLQQKAPAIQDAHAHWVRGLLFGYDSEAIQQFILSSSSGQESMLRYSPYKNVRGKVEIYDCRANTNT